MTPKQYGTSVLSALIIFGMSFVTQAAPVVEVDQERFRLDLAPYIDVLEDRQGRLDIEAIMTGEYNNQFSPLPPSALFFGYTESVFWLRFVVESRLDHDRPLVVEVMPADIDYIDLYAVDPANGTLLMQKRSGSAINFDARDYDHPLYFFDINAERESRHIYYLRLESDKNINVRLHLSTVREHFYFSGMRDWAHGLLIGAMILLGVLHIIFAFVFNYKAFAYYGLTALIVVFLQASWDGYFIQFMDADASLLDQQLMLCVYLSNVTFLLFARTYLDTHQRTPTIHRILTAFIVIGLMGVPCSWLFDSTINAYLSGLYTLPSIFLVFGLAVYSFMEGYEPARYFLIARTLTIAAILVTVFADQGLLPQGFLGGWGVSVASVLESSIFLVAMIAQQLAKQRQSDAGKPAAPGLSPTNSVPLSAFCHELRTPISGVLGMSELLLDTALTDQQRLQVETIHHSGRSLMEVANKMSDLAAFEAGDVRLNDGLFEMASVIETVVESARDLAERNRVEFIYRVDEAVAGFFRGDREKLQQAVYHLVGLGIRRRQGGELLLTVHAGVSDQIHFEIVTGNDTMADEMAVMQDVSVSLSSADSLNVSIARRFIALMGGELRLEPRADQGIRCHFFVVLRREQRQVTAFDGEQILRGKSLVVVDDNETCCKIIEQQAIQWGMDVFTATGSKEALAMLRSRANMGPSFDILLVDYEMPGMNGVQLIQKIRQESDVLHTRDIIFVILTGVSRMPSQVLQKEIDVRAVLYKPLSGKSLKAALIDALQHSSAKRQRPNSQG